MGEAGPTGTSPWWGPEEQLVLLEVGESLACLGTKVNRPGVREGMGGVKKLIHAQEERASIGLTKVLAQHLAQRRPREREPCGG